MADMAMHSYRSHLAWSGSTAAGYAQYDRTHRVDAPPAVAGLTMSSDPASTIELTLEA
jgi:hypothetical protein